jgi:hypothetical protein
VALVDNVVFGHERVFMFLFWWVIHGN